ncbi:MAG: hypothetical protein R3A80_10900 [Bdellovibrionota bacterium]
MNVYLRMRWIVDLNLCEDVSCGGGYVDLSYCVGGGDVSGCTDPLANNYKTRRDRHCRGL